jgi:TatA/E family protein of Tat protein translocase
MNLGMPEMIFIFLMALIIFGPKKLPEIGRQIGKFMNEFKRASNEFKSQIESEISQLDVTERQQQILPPAEPPRGTVASGALSDADAPVPEVTPPPTELNSVAKAPNA